MISWALSMVLNIITICSCYYLTVSTSYRHLVKKHNYGIFFLTLLLNVAIFCLLIWSSRHFANWFLSYTGIHPVKNKHFDNPMFNNYFMIFAEMIISYFALLCLPLASKFFRDQMRHQWRENDLKKKNLHLQMDFLKAQIHPHFLFNTLNNIYSLNLNAEQEKASEMISRLSSLLRYVLYKGNAEFISLQNEVAMIQDFINLEAIRSDNLKLTLRWPDEIDSDIYLPPFLLLPLVENAFKHGVNSQLDQSFIYIYLHISQREITLTVENSYDVDYREKNAGGLGLANLQLRLDYYYPQNYSLKTAEKNNCYFATLKLPCYARNTLPNRG